MGNLSNQDVQLGQNFYTTSTAPQAALGQRGSTSDGRVFRYALAGAVDLEAGKVVQSPATQGGHQTLVLSTTAPISSTGIGGSSISVTCASCVAANFFAEGYAVIASGAGQGFMYQLDSHPAVSTGATGTFPFYQPIDANALVTAITATSTVTLSPNKYRGVVAVPATTATGRVVGVATYVIPAATYGWIQTWGQCAVLTNDASALGQWMNGIAASCGRVAGMSSPAVTACYIVGQPVGNIMQTGVAGQYCIIDLTISP